MKVTLLTKKDFASSGFEIVKALRMLGVDAEIIALNKPNFRNDSSKELKPSQYKAAEKRVRESDIIHWKGDDPPADNFFGKFKIPPKPTVFLAGGSRFRRKGFSGFAQYPLDRYRSDFKGAVTPELCYEDVVWCPHVWSDFQYKFKPSERFRIVHVPSSKAVKGSEIIRDAINILRGIRDDFDYIETTGIPHSECMELKQSAHIYIDQVILPHYAMAGVEAMAYGIPLFAYATTTPVKNPVIVPNDNTPEKIAEKLNEAMNWDNLTDISERTFEYAKQVHGRGGEMWINIYNEVLRNYEKKKIPFTS